MDQKVIQAKKLSDITSEKKYANICVSGLLDRRPFYFSTELDPTSALEKHRYDLPIKIGPDFT